VERLVPVATDKINAVIIAEKQDNARFGIGCQNDRVKSGQQSQQQGGEGGGV